MQYEYVTINMDNNPAWNAEIPAGEYRKIIEEKAQQGLRYVGWLPVKSGPTGKLLSLDLVFEKPSA